MLYAIRFLHDTFFSTPHVLFIVKKNKFTVELRLWSTIELTGQALHPLCF